MRIRNFIFVFIAACFFASGCGKAEWKDFKSEAGKFSVQLPGVPEEKTQPVNVAKLGNVNMFTYTLEQSDGAYMAAYNDYPAGLFAQVSTDKVLDGARDGAVGNMQGGKLISEQKIAIGNYPGRDIVAEGAQGNMTFVVKARVYLVNYRLYQVMAIMPKDKSSSIDAAKFLDSFKLIQ